MENKGLEEVNEETTEEEEISEGIITEIKAEIKTETKDKIMNEEIGTTIKDNKEEWTSVIAGLTRNGKNKDNPEDKIVEMKGIETIETLIKEIGTMDTKIKGIETKNTKESQRKEAETIKILEIEVFLLII
jgi:hypothetical protein